MTLLAGQWVNTNFYAGLQKLVIRYWTTAVAFSIPFILYLFTAAPTIYNLDSAEITTAAATGGLMRATGYPLYLSLGYLWSKIPIGDVGYRLNLFSAFNGALTIAITDRLLSRWRIGPWVSFSALGLLATGTYFWGLSLIAEVYTLHTAIMAGLILALIRWREFPSPSRLSMAALMIGMGLSHHVATALLLPGAIVYLLTSSRDKLLALKPISLALLGLLAGLSFYLYLPLRYAAQPQFNYAGHYNSALTLIPQNLHSLNGLWWIISGRAFSGQMFAYQMSEIGRETWHFIMQLWRAFFAIGIGPGFLGMFLFFRRQKREAFMLTLMFICTAMFYINYRVLDKDTMFLPAYLIWSIWVAYGYEEVLSWVRQVNINRPQQWITTATYGVIFSFVLLAAIRNWGAVNLSDDWSARQRGETILQKAQPNALILGWWDTIPVIQYLQLVEGKRPDVQATLFTLTIHPKTFLER